MYGKQGLQNSKGNKRFVLLPIYYWAFFYFYIVGLLRIKGVIQGGIMVKQVYYYGFVSSGHFQGR